MEQLSIVVIGGGMVGLAAALALAKAGFTNIGLIEQQVFPILNEDIHRPIGARVSAITPASVNFFKALGVWEQLPASRIGIIDKMQVWEDDAKPMLFTASSARVPALGYIIENEVVVAELAQCVREQSAIQLLMPCQLQTLTRTPDGFTITLADGKTIQTPLLIGADGAHSWVRKQLDMAVTIRDYQQTAIVATVATELPHQQIARQSFDKTSTCAFLPLADQNQISLVWSVDKAMVDALLALAPSVFAEHLAVRMQHCLGQLNLVSDRAHFALVSRRVEQYTQAHLALVGDAARSVHPLAGQGVNLGLKDAALLVETLQQAKAEKRQIADAYVLKRYERAAKANAKRMLFVIDGVFRLFKTDFPLANKVRQTGFQGIAKCEPVLAWLMRQAMGL
ncbi:MAG: FAD-dependent monooxygenase [Gammaproteobacteria bacterium]|nr:FAD-dependent monooxygenase [Gammaproteobacteria bacterium]